MNHFYEIIENLDKNLPYELLSYFGGVILAITNLYNWYIKWQYLDMDDFIKFSAFFEKNDKSFFDDFMVGEIRKKVYKKATGIDYRYKEKVSWIDKRSNSRFSYRYLRLALPYLEIDTQKETIKIKRDKWAIIVSTFSGLFSLFSFCLALLTGFSSGDYLQFAFFILLTFVYSFGLHPFIYPTVIKNYVSKALKEEKNPTKSPAEDPQGFPTQLH